MPARLPSSFFDSRVLIHSKEFYLRKKSPVLGFSVYLLLAITLIGLLWMAVFRIEVVVRGQAVIRPWSNIALVRNVVAGEVTSVTYLAGDYVREGEELWRIDTSEQAAQLSEVLPLLDLRSRELRLYNTMIEAASLPLQNPFDERSERDFHVRFRALRSEYFRRRAAVDEVAHELATERAKPAQYRLESAVRRLEIQQRGALEALDSWFASSVGSLFDQRNRIQETVASLEQQRERLETEIERAVVRAPASGFITEAREASAGEVLAANETVIRIVPQAEHQLRVRLRIPPSEVAELERGMRVRIRFDSLPPRDYGFVEGSIIDIPGDATILEDGTPVFYIEALIPSFVRHTSDDTRINLRPGMSGEGRIVKKEVTVLGFVADMLDWR